MKFRSAVDTWFYVLALAVPFVVIGSTTISFSSLSALLVIGIAALIALGLPIWLIFSTYYVIEAGTLLIRSGPFSWSIPVSEIKSIRPSRSVISSPALSLNRLEIQYSQGHTILVSPKDAAGFKNALGAIK